eukprot:CAMPEP_0197077696 /NCGR_PEP_ID=MMETSP1384-20130603/212751_1 /TAXON_ID=29189 /ORGANISM="Ammonia sp." /LENGTH=195 /DNA_ID=CAMNT_0042516561 /DNA_START=432 /DNA_END=1019 /DNA_ORIENTATION=+
MTKANAVQTSTVAAKRTKKQRPDQHHKHEDNPTESKVNLDGNKDFISYRDIKLIFDEIDQRYAGSNVGALENSSNCHLNVNALTNCELYSPIPECSENGESDVDEIPIWERNQHTLNPLSFGIRVEDESKLAGESNFVLINVTDIDDFYCSDQSSYYLDTVNDVLLGALFSYNEAGNLHCLPSQEPSFDDQFVLL